MGLSLKSNIYSVNKKGIHVREYHPPKPVQSNLKKILFAHGIGFHGGVFNPMISSLCSLGYSCYSLDFRGHGYSHAPSDGKYDWKAFSEDCIDVVSTLGLEGCHAFGHSFGGHALLMAEIQKPGMFASIYTFEPFIIIFPGDVEGANFSIEEHVKLKWYYTLHAKHRRTHFSSIDEAFDSYKTKLAFRDWDQIALKSYVYEGGFICDDITGGVALACDPVTEIAIYETGLNAVDAFRRLKDISCPVLIARGKIEDGRLSNYPAMVAPFLVNNIPNATLMEFPNNSHLAPVENPYEILHSALSFFNLNSKL